MSETDIGTKIEAGIAGENASFPFEKWLKTTTLQPFLQDCVQIAGKFLLCRTRNDRCRTKTIYLQEILDKAS
jgi:hypothetical protein